VSWTQLFPRRLVAGVGSAVNWLAQTKPAVLLATVLSAIAGAVSTGVTVSLGTVSALGGYLGAGISTALTVSGSVLQSVRPGFTTSSVLTMTTPPAQTPAFDVVRLTVDLTGTYGAATQSGGSGFTNPTNALGAHNGVSATHAGAATSSPASLQLAYPSFPNKDSLTITSVIAKVYYNQTGTTLNNGVLACSLLKGGAAGTIVASVSDTGNVDFMTTPRSFDVTSSFTTWADLATFAAVFTHNTPAANFGACAIDAVELVVTATRTDLL
jgi:hypothetical protein